MSSLHHRFGVWLYSLSMPLMRYILRKQERVYAVIIWRGQVLMVKNWLSRDEWRFPGGGMNHRETPQEALEREIEEELRLRVDQPFQFVDSGTMKTDRLGFVYRVYAIRLAAEPLLRHNRLEITATSWHRIAPAQCSEEIRRVFKLLKRRRMI